MSMGLRLVAEYYDTATDKTVTSITVRKDDIKTPKTIKDLGYLHEVRIIMMVNSEYHDRERSPTLQFTGSSYLN